VEKRSVHRTNGRVLFKLCTLHGDGSHSSGKVDGKIIPVWKWCRGGNGE
jgi:hypothetical protein